MAPSPVFFIGGPKRRAGAEGVQMKKEQKTNVMRVLDARRIPYAAHTYQPDASMSGAEIAALLGENPDSVFKTLVTQGKTGQYYVFVIPVRRELDLKKAALAAGEKSVSMIPQKELLPLTGYVHGGCSPVGMKKAFLTFVQECAARTDPIFVSAGKVGAQVEVHPGDLQGLLGFRYADLTADAAPDEPDSGE